MLENENIISKKYFYSFNFFFKEQHRLMVIENKSSEGILRNCNIALNKRQRRNLTVFESSYHLPTAHGGALTLSVFIAEHQAGKVSIPLFMDFGLIRPGIEHKSTVLVADDLSTRPLKTRRVGEHCSAITSQRNSAFCKI